jgi:hypothetical protein
MSERPTLLLDPANPHDWDAGELEQFACDLEAQIPGVSAVPIRRPEEGYGGPLIEVLHVWQEYSSAVGGVATTAAGAGWIIQALQKRWRRDREEHPEPERPRGRLFDLYDENDELIRSVSIDLPDGEPVEKDVAPGERAAHPRPKSEWQSNPGERDQSSQ